MSNEITNAFVQQYSSNVYMLTQQRGSKLIGTVMRKEITGKYANFERLGSVVATKKTSRHTPTPQTDTPHSRRRVGIEDYHVNDYIDKEDEIRMLIDPKGPYATAQSNALGRTLDDIIITAIQGNASSVDSDDAASNVALPAGQIVDEDFGSANSDLTLAKVIEAKRLFMTNEVQPDEEYHFLADAVSLNTLLQEADVKTIDSNTIKTIVAGEPGSLMGFNFKHTERLKDSSEGFKNCLAYVKSGIGLAMGSDIKVRIDERSDLSYAKQVYSSMTAGAVRIEEEKVVIVEAYRA